MKLIASRAGALLARCRICGRKLSDEVSIDIGVGPKCRSDAGYNEAWAACADRLKPLARAALRSITAAEGKVEEVLHELSILNSLGFSGIVDALSRKLAIFAIDHKDDGTIEVRHNYCPSLYYGIRRMVPGSRIGEEKRTKFHILPAASAEHLAAALRKAVPGTYGYSSKQGLMLVGEGSSWQCLLSLDVPSLEAAAARLAGSSKPACQALAGQLNLLTTASDDCDWRPTETIPEDMYAL